MLPFSSRDVAHGEHFVDQEQVGFRVDGDGEAQAHVHSGRIVLDRRVDELAQLRIAHDAVQPIVDLGATKAVDRAVEVNVFPASQVQLETGAQFQQRGKASADDQLAVSGFKNAGDEFEQRALAGTVGTDNAHAVAARNGERDVAQRPEDVGRRLGAPKQADEEFLQRAAAVSSHGEHTRDAVQLDQWLILARRAQAQNGHTSSPNRPL